MASYERIPYLILFQESAGYKDTYAGPMDQVVLKAHLLKPKDQPADTVLILMHPIGGGEYLPMTVALAKAGCHVIYCQSRYPNNDSALIMDCLLYTSPSPRDRQKSRMPSSA